MPFLNELFWVEAWMLSECVLGLRLGRCFNEFGLRFA